LRVVLSLSRDEATRRSMTETAANDTDPRFVRRPGDRLSVDEERLSRIDRERRRARHPHRVNRGEADDGHVEPHVLFRLGDLDQADRRTRANTRGPRELLRGLPRL